MAVMTTHGLTVMAVLDDGDPHSPTYRVGVVPLR